MPVICYNEEQFYFPPVDEADEEGLLIVGGAVTAERVLEAYSKGIFPWYNDDSLPLWWSPDPRFVLFPDELHISRSMQKVLRKGEFEFRFDTAFKEVLQACATVPRAGQEGTWITPSMAVVYNDLHRLGFAHSAETWKSDQLVGGVYGLQIGNVFFGESMFSKESNASKFAFVQLVQRLRKASVAMLDCQVYTDHVQTLGARLISREEFINLLNKLTG